MNPNAVAHANARYGKAERALNALESASSFDEAEDAWTDFLIAANSIYSKFEQGAKGHGKSKAWLGRKRAEQKKDQLLRYLKFARNSDEHGIERVTTRDPGSALLGRPMAFQERHPLKIFLVDPETHQPISAAQDAFVPGPHLALVTAHDRRFGDSCDPPIEHLGKQIPFGQPLDVGRAVLPYLGRLIEEAAALV